MSIPAELNVDDCDFLCGFCSARKLNELTKAADQIPTIQAAQKNPINYAGAVKGIRREEDEQAKKARNVIIRGTKPSENEKDLVVDIASKAKLNINSDAIEDVKRIGNPNEQGLQTLLVIFKEEKTKWKMIGASKGLKDVPHYKAVFINPDLTPAEQQEQWNLRRELKRQREANTNKKFIIRKGAVVEAK